MTGSVSVSAPTLKSETRCSHRSRSSSWCGRRWPDLPNVEAELWPGLLADFAVRHHASAIVRGVRNTTDFDVEYQMALINRGIHPELETLLLPASAAYQHFSSSMAREMIRYHQPLENYLPASIVPLVREMTEKKEG